MDKQGVFLKIIKVAGSNKCEQGEKILKIVKPACLFIRYFKRNGFLVLLCQKVTVFLLNSHELKNEMAITIIELHSSLLRSPSRYQTVCTVI